MVRHGTYLHTRRRCAEPDDGRAAVVRHPDLARWSDGEVVGLDDPRWTSNGGAVDRVEHRELIDTLVTDQALWIQGLEDGTYVLEANPTAAPTVVTLPVESSPGSTWAALAAGLGLGLSVAALIAIRPALRRQERASGLDVFQPSTES